MAAYYNEFDPFAAAWLRELIKADVIADGEVDERSISDVAPNDLAGFTQCHFFAGIGVWSYALRNAGWSDDQPVWTGSCPCQPFSSAGKGTGFDDERHLWPAFFHLISIETPPVVFGEQVASKDGLAWLDLVHADLEGSGHTVGAVDTCAAGFGAPHIRQRLYWVADSMCGRTEHGSRKGVGTQTEAYEGNRDLSRERLRIGFESPVCGMADSLNTGLEGHTRHEDDTTGRQEQTGPAAESGTSDGLDDSSTFGRDQRGDGNHTEHDGKQLDANGEDGRPSPTNGCWKDADWLLCRDGKWRAVEPGTFPLADKSPDRVGRLRGFGNAIVADQAQAFIESYVEIKQSQISKAV